MFYCHPYESFISLIMFSKISTYLDEACGVSYRLWNPETDLKNNKTRLSLRILLLKKARFFHVLPNKIYNKNYFRWVDREPEPGGQAVECSACPLCLGGSSLSKQVRLIFRGRNYEINYFERKLLWNPLRRRVCISVCLYVCMSVLLYVSMSVWLYVCMSVCLYDCMSVLLYVCMSVWLYVCMSVCLYVCMSVCMSVCLYVCMSVCLYDCMSVCLYVCMSVCLYVCMSVCLYIFMSVCLYVCILVAGSGGLCVDHDL